MPAVESKIKIPSEPIKAKFADIKSEKYFIPSWSFASWVILSKKSFYLLFVLNLFFLKYFFLLVY